MAEKKGVGHAYNVDFLNVVFAASSIFLFLSIVWMVWDDYDRDWKNTQRRFAQLQYDVTRAQYQQASRAVDKGEAAAAAAAARRGAEERRRRTRRRSTSCRRSSTTSNIRLDRAQRDYQYAKATYDHDRYDFESSRAAKQPGFEKKGETRRPRRRSTLSDAQPAGREADRRARRRPEEPGAVHRAGDDDRASRSKTCTPRRRACARCSIRVAPSAGEGLLPQRAAARFHGADDQDSAAHPARTSSTT